MAYEPTGEEFQVIGARAQSVNTYKQLLAERDGKVAAARSTIGPGSDAWRRAENNLTKAEADTRAVSAKLGRLTNGNRLSGWWFLLIGVSFALLEAPINKFMLDNIVRGNNFDSYALSVFVTFVLLGLAHYAGHQTRQIRGEYEEVIHYYKIVIAAFITLVLAGCVGVLTIGRAFYSVAGVVAIGKDIFSEIGRQIVTIGPWASFVAALSDNAALFLALLNTAGLAIAFLAAFTRFDSDENYQSALDAEKKTNKILSRMEKKYTKVVDRVAKNMGRSSQMWPPRMAQ